MIRTIVTPLKQTISFDIPKEYVGKQIEVIAFVTDEGVFTEEFVPKKVSFNALSIDTKDYKFNRTKQMSVNVFFDTNILVYSYSTTEIDKQAIARKLIEESNSFISTQVLQEMSNTVTRKFKFSYQTAIAAINECCQNNNLHINTEATIVQACRIAERYGFSFYDSLIISAAIECNCATLFSEDLNDGQLVDGTLRIKNPFVK